MILTTEQLRERAHELALTHDLHVRRRESSKLRRSVVSDVNQLSSFIHDLRKRPTACSQPAEEWLLDHAEFLEEQALIVVDQFAEHFLYALPSLRISGELRILSICDDYLTQMDGSMEEKSLLAYINYYQEVSILTIAEVWVVPLVMRLALFRNLAKAMATIQERRAICMMVEQWLTRFEPSKFSPVALKSALEEAGQDIPLSGPMIVHLVSHLREWADDTAVIREWLMCKLDNGQESLDRIVAYEHELQASYQMRTGNLIGSMRSLSRWDWRVQFEQLCLVEQTLRQDPSGDYPLLDYSSRDTLRKRVEQLARRLHVPENLIANQVVKLATQHLEQAQQDTMIHSNLPRQAYIPYYLLEAKGIQQLQRELKACSNPRSIPEEGIWRRATGTYFNFLILSYVVILLGFIVWIGSGVRLTPLDLLLMVILLSFPAIEWATTWMHGLIEWRKGPTPLLRYDFSNGITSEATTMVVIPVIWSTTQEVREIADRLELHYLVSRDPNIHFALLGDFKDSETEQRPEDQAVLEAAQDSIEKFNRIYPGNVFHLYHRRRLWNSSEGKWMGWERKRGKLVEFIELLKGKKDTSYDYIISDSSNLARIRYMITLDADTQLPPGSPQRMIGTMHLPYNRPRMNRARTRVIEGYGILQPRIAMSYQAANCSRLAYLWSGETGVDPYAFAVSDPYQDGLGQGIFTGKGIFDVHAFAELVCDRIPENRVLSHDLLEGGFLRTGLLSDIELIDGHPALFSTYQKRLHRWIRGDWQLLLWLFPRVHNQRGVLLPIDLSIVTRWQIIDNLRRSLLPVMTFVLLFLAFTVLPGSPERWLAVVLITWLFPVLRQVVTVRRMKKVGIAAGQVLVQVITLPYHSVMSLDAVIRTGYRLFVSKHRLLQWVSSAEIEQSSIRGRQPVLLGMYSGLALTIIFTLASVIQDDLFIRAAGITLGLLWASAPFVIQWLNKPMQVIDEHVFAEDECEKLRKLSRDIWSFFEVYVTVEDHWFPPDNVQLDPPNGVAHRTSPTNIGLYLTCALAARDFGFIDTPELIERLECTVSSIEKLVKWEGHLLNWYDTQTLQPLIPQYVSTVDSGNFVACLMTVREGLTESLNNDSDSERHPLIARLEALIQGTDFRPLYDHNASLFSLGYNVGRHERDTIVYDLMASEARQASFIAIALGQISVSHWRALGRTMTKVGQHAALLSWSGTMFEYLMPWLFMRTYRNSIWDSTYRAVVQRQIEYAHSRGVPFGISESGYYAFDYQMNYQYQAFGVPGLGFKRGLEQDLVVAPYATIMALPYAKHQGLIDLDRLEKLGARGEYGYYEAIDYTLARLPKDQDRKVIKSFMAHHQGMSLLTLANVLLPQKMYDRFHSNKYIRSVELLLQERIPLKPRILHHPIKLKAHMPETKPIHISGFREYHQPSTLTPEVCVLSNGAYMTAVSVSGGGFSRYEGISITRWQEDPVMDRWGSYIYIRDVTQDQVWSPTFHPCRVRSPEQYARFSLDSALFTRVDGNIRTSMEICVSPESNAEIRRLSLTNNGAETRIMEVTTFQELALAHPVADDAHPAFSKLFVRTQYLEESECLVAGRRPREVAGKPIWAAHSLIVDGRTIGTLEYETDRARFIGRGHTLAQPQGIRQHLRGTVGSVADPAFVMRRRISIGPGEQIHLFAITSIADSKEEAVGIVHRMVTSQAVEQTFQLAWNRSQIELRQQRLTVAEAIVFQNMAGQLLYTSPLKAVQEMSIQHNVKSQSSLWAHGISGDRSIALVRIHNQTDLRFIIKLLTGHEYLRRMGISFDLVILNESVEGYQQSLQDALKRIIENNVDRLGAGPVGIYIINTEHLSYEDATLLFATARMVLRADGPSLKSQLKVKVPKTVVPEQLERIAPTYRMDTTQQADTSDLIFFNGWGGFSSNGKEYRIILKNSNHLPAPWINVIANPQFGCLVSELGTGYTWWRNSREFKLTSWSNDPVLDPPSEMCYLRDEESGDLWSTSTSTLDTDKTYTVTHGRGFTRINHERHGIEHEMTIAVPLDDSVKMVKLIIRNKTKATRQISITYYAEWVLGVRRQGNAPLLVTDWESSAHVLLARNAYQETFRGAYAFLGIYPQEIDQEGHVDPSSSEEGVNLSWTADRTEFVGRDGTMEQPAAMTRNRLSCQTGSFHDPCGAVQAKVRMEPESERVVYILLGCESSREAAVNLTLKYSRTNACELALKHITDYWNEALDQITVNTPCKEMDILLNGWLLYQTLACRMWARSAFYQAGGAYGFRDQLQDSLALLHTRSDLTKRQIQLHASHQYEEGDVQHWWHEETERGIRTLFTDDLLWLPYSVARYVDHTGDIDILEMVEPYLNSEPLREGEHERYESTVRSNQQGSIYDHCLRAIDRSLQRFGEHGLPLIGVGDWNDGMNLVGAKGRGESVWLGWFLCDVLTRFTDLCMNRGENDRAKYYQSVREQLSSALDEYAWDGGWYRRAFTDVGGWLGSMHNEECRIDAIAQSWSVISGAGSMDKTIKAMESFDLELVDRDLAVVRLLTPPFDLTDPSPGYIQGYPPGIRENGAQYTHGAIWSIIAWSKLGNGDKAFELFHILNPLSHTRTPHEVRQYAGEPYVMAADVYTEQPHMGRAGWTWYTGAAGWMYQAGVEWIVGIRRHGNQLQLQPCIPSEWPEYSIRYHYGKAIYDITVLNPLGKSSGVSKLRINDQFIILSESDSKYGPSIALIDDAQEHHIELTM
jgi:cyclic beta-1,2-glucan synthetase